MKVLILAGFLLSTAIGFADPPRFVFVVKNDPNPDGKYRVDIGEVYQFVRTMSVAELHGGAPDPTDATYFVVQMEDVKIVAPATNFVPVEQKDLMAATQKYAEEVAALRKSTGNTLSQEDRTAMIQELRHAHFISSYSAGEQMSDRELTDRYQEYKRAIANLPPENALQRAREEGEEEGRQQGADDQRAQDATR